MQARLHRPFRNVKVRRYLGCCAALVVGGSQLVEFVGGVESHRRELPQWGGVELDVGRSNTRMSFDCVTGDLPTAQGDLDARAGTAGAADMSGLA